MSPASKKKTAKKKVAKKSVAVKKSASKSTEKPDAGKKATGKKVATKKSVAKKKSVRKKSTGNTGFNVSPEERWKMVAVAAYLKAEKRGFATGNELEDWTEAEKEIDTLLQG